MDKTLTLQKMYPQMTYKDYVVEDNWSWPVLRWFNKDVEEPTLQEMQNVWNIMEQEKAVELEKLEKKEAIEKIASISEQLNLTAWTLDIVVDLLSVNNPEILQNPWIIESKQKLNQIKNILNN